jgi:hypothetical protein
MVLDSAGMKTSFTPLGTTVVRAVRRTLRRWIAPCAGRCTVWRAIVRIVAGRR